VHFRQVSAKIQPKNLKQHSDRGEGRGVSAPLCMLLSTTVINFSFKGKAFTFFEVQFSLWQNSSLSHLLFSICV